MNSTLIELSSLKSLAQISAYSAVLAQMPIRLAIFDDQMRYVSCSDAWNRTFQPNATSVIGESYYDLVPNIPQRWRQLHQLGLQGEPQSAQHDVWIDENGETNYLNWSISPWYDSEGEIGGIIIVTEDVTQECRNQLSLLESQKRYQLVLQATENGIFDWDIKKNTQYWSRQFYEMLGLEDQSVEAGFKSWETLINPKDKDRLLEELRIALANPNCRQVSFTYEMMHAKGHVVPVLNRAVIERNSKGEATRMVGAHADQSRLLQMQQVAESSALEVEVQLAANKSKSAFLATITHEIRNPLNGILGVTELLEQKADDPDTTELLTIQRGAIMQLSGLLNDVLDHSKIEAGKLEFHPKVFDLNAMLEEMAKLKRLRCQQKGLQFSLTKSFWNGTYYRADPVRVRQVLQNYLSNALKFTNKGLISLVIGTERLDDRFDLLTFRVTDTGIGIKAKDLSQLFQPFSQVDHSETNTSSSTGLGLSIVKNLAEQMGGQVGVISEYGKGSTFTVSLKLERASKADMPVPWAKMGEVTRALDILVVDDDDITRKITTRLLANLGHKVGQARSGNLALLAVQNKNYDLVISDYSMPDMTGTVFLKKYRQACPMGNTRFVCLSGHSQKEFVKAVLDAGFDAYFSKPLVLNDLIQTMAQMFKGG